jgi:hypothetical protein
MKSFLWTMGAVCAATAGFLVWNPYKKRPVEDLAHSLQDAWADNHTIV